MDDKDFYSGLIRLHILHHAVHETIFGLGIIEELARHGYKLSAGTLYPMLHDMERKGYLHSTVERSGRHSRRVYCATPLGKQVLEDAKQKVKELFGELFEDRG
ncbi:PadR family transcriptional regulator [Scytonema hofmannii PCC 7110]|jgi:PadR family transcriptional regulator, regulatory protein PadR|uniref:PadR family transcriptional regulator n=1 Tax=Scytonema hofmannii PCC 7110 TaxID=128403 RepID=A0A139WW28_9CYAN|nr:helix-turn-helix transcriptional regulator [Scytonema hofmannii]KYC36636.1 PadR family transcriptional regulator [Scytonema hofmannii PCC 7110]